ncbi:MAG: 50S ribosomal protein L25 [Treponema sp.]|nr:50S ribosomal protein L25 [Candidatus Treponema caballi]
MDYMTVNAEERKTTGKRAAKALRATGKLPAVMYNSKGEATMLSVEEAEFTKVWKLATPTTLIKLVVGKKEYLAFIKDTEYDIITDKNLHVDFQVIDEDKPLVVPIKILLDGNPAGVREGGLLQKGTNSMKIKCMPKDLPVRIKADISALKIGEGMKVGQIALPEGVEIVSDKELVIAFIKAPRA